MNSARWLAGATSSSRCCRETGAATRASIKASTLDPDAVERIWRYFDEGGPDNMAACLAFLASEIGCAAIAAAARSGQRLRPLRRGLFRGRAERGARPHRLLSLHLSRQRSRSHRSAGAGASRQGACGHERLRDRASRTKRRSRPYAPFSIASASTSCSTPPPFPRAWMQRRGTALDALDAPVLQVVLAGVGLEAWRASQRGLGPSDLAMHVALPEIDGRILTRAISFKEASARDAQTEFADGRASAARRSCRVHRRACSPLGEPPAQGAGGQTPRLRAAGLSGARRAHRLCRRPRYAGERRRDRRDPARRGL